MPLPSYFVDVIVGMPQFDGSRFGIVHRQIFAASSRPDGFRPESIIAPGTTYLLARKYDMDHVNFRRKNVAIGRKTLLSHEGANMTVSR